MNEQDIIKTVIEKNMGIAVTGIEKAGSGASASVYCAHTDKFDIAVKISEHHDIISEEYEMLKLIKSKVECKTPKVYFTDSFNNKSILAMEYINGISGASNKIRYKFHKRRLANDIVDNLLKIQNVHNSKFGPIKNAVYDTWYDYYKGFANKVFDFCSECVADNKLEKSVYNAVEASYNNLEIILNSTKEAKPTLIHGDYWLPNFIVDEKEMKLAGVVDPFNMMWAEPEYEIFAMTVGYGSKLKLYDIYKSKVNVSAYCDMKLELYALYSELLWYKKLGDISHGYLIFRAKRLMKQMRKNGII